MFDDYDDNETDIICKYVSSTDKAICVEIDGDKKWIPISQIYNTSVDLDEFHSRVARRRKRTDVKEVQMSLYCIEFTRELEEKEVIHAHYDHEPTRDDIIKTINDEGFHYDDDYGKLEYYPVAGI